MRRSIAIILVSLCAVFLFSACTTALTSALAPLVLGALPVSAAESDIVARPELNDRQDLADYQGTLPHLVLSAGTAQPTQSRLLTLDDRQDLADYQATLGSGYVE